jgi:hypothetical protein
MRPGYRRNVAGHRCAQLLSGPARRSGLDGVALRFPQVGDGFDEPGEPGEQRHLCEDGILADRQGRG